MKLSARRFPHTITRKREMPGERNEFGEFVPGATEEVKLRANVQPLSNEDEDVTEGTRVDETVKVFVAEPDALVAAYRDRRGDEVVIDEVPYLVIAARSWRDSHTRAICQRQEA